MGRTLNFPAAVCRGGVCEGRFRAEARTNDVLRALRERQVIMLIGFEMARNIITA